MADVTKINGYNIKDATARSEAASNTNRKLDKNQGAANSGKILGVNATGEVEPTDTEVATLVDVPNGIVKGDGSTLSAAEAGTDYMAPVTGGTVGQVLTKTANGQEWADAPKTVTIPKTTALLKGDGTGVLVAATPETDYASPVFMRKVTLPVASWNSSTKQQSVTVSGILADTTKQCIYPAPVDTSYDSAWNSCGVLCVAQAANSLTFQCSEIPTSAIEVYVTVITLSYKG